MAMPYTHTTADGRAHYLHGKTVAFPDGRREALSWLARRPKPAELLGVLPAGYRVAERPVTRRPSLRKA